MAEAKKATTRKKAEPKEPEPTLVEGFTTADYEGNELFTCDLCGFDTFSVELANSHRASHGATEAAAAEVADLTENLAERAEVTTEEAPDGQS